MNHIKPIYRSKNLFFFLFLFCLTTTSYGQQTACPNDFDCDGIMDALDVDDDNDGIYDHVESPNCFYLDKAIHQSGDRRAFWEVSTALPYTSGSPDLLIDGSTRGFYIQGAKPISNIEIVRLSSNFLGGIAFSSFVFNTSGLFSTNTKVILQGSQDGETWTDLTEVLLMPTTANVTIKIIKNQQSYRIYRLLGVSGYTKSGTTSITEITGTVGAYMPSLFPKSNCDGEDIDNDGLPNHQDLDADGDGGSDVLETGFVDEDNDGMLGLSPVTVDQFGAVTSAVGYILPNAYYKIMAVNAAVDTDGDGVLDVYDLDDDNDGIFDHFESPSCFNLVTDFEIGDRRELLSVSTDLVYTTGSVDLLIDGSTTTGILFPTAGYVIDKEIVKLTTRLIAGIEFRAIVLHFNTSSFFTSAKVILQGTKDGLEWVDLTEELIPSNSSVITFPVTKNQGNYGMYRLLGTAGIITGNRSITEITTIVGAHIPSSLLPKLNCTDEDVDQDGIPNHKDLDADGDGDLDVIEAGFDDADNDGMLGTSPATVNQFGVVISNRGNAIPLEFYKMAAYNSTNDFDGDGVIDLLDVDDDNDGIYDHIESPTCFYINPSSYEIGDRRKILDSSTTLPYTVGNVEFLVDGNITDLSGISIGAVTPLSGQEIVRITTKLAKGIEYKSIVLTVSAPGFFTTTSKVVIQGSQDGNIWTDLSDVLTPEATAVVSLTITKNQGSYRIYRIWGMSGFTGTTAKIITEVTTTIGTYMPSLFPKLICIGEDVDNDGKPNHQDLNSDGDTCNDVIEAGFLDLDRDGILGTSPVTVDQYGKITSAIGYSVPSNMYFIDATKNVCTGQGIPIDEYGHCVDLDNMSNDAKLIQGAFHSSIARTKSGFVIFGENTRPSGSGPLVIPTEIVPAKGFTYEGTIMDATLGGNRQSGTQHFVLATGGLYTWGFLGYGIPASWTSDQSFQKIDLPNGLSPSAIKFISASTTNLVLLTKSGDVYIAAGSLRKAFGAYGDGSTTYDELWHKSNISHVVSIKVNSSGQALALTFSGDLYVWGKGVIVGDGSAAQDLLQPTKITFPTAVTKVNMIASSSSAIYVLGDDKRVYSTGINEFGQLGMGNLQDQLSWQTVKNPSGTAYLENIKFINATIHDSTDGAAAAIDEAGIAYLWGDNDKGKLGLGTGGYSGVLTRPRIPDGTRPGFHNIMYIEPGGHVTPIVDIKTGKFGYVGHRINGSMGNGTTAESFVDAYDFTNTPFIDFCGLTFGEIKMTRIMLNPMNINSNPIK